MWRSFGLLALTFAVVYGQGTTTIDQCTDQTLELPLNVNVAGCETPPCLLPQLQDAVVDVIFKAPRLVYSLKTVTVAFLNIGIATIRYPYDLAENAITCNFLTNTYCPVLEGEVVQYSLRMFIESFFPVNTQVALEFSVVDENEVNVFCFRVVIRVAPPLDSRSVLEHSSGDQVIAKQLDFINNTLGTGL